MKRFFIFLSLFFLCVSCFAQTITLKFTGRDAQGHYCQLNYVTVTNLSKNWQETISWPDTTLVLNNEDGIDEYRALPNFKLSQNVPNPFDGTTDISLNVAGNEDVYVEVADMSGKIVLIKNITKPQTGTYIFRVELSTPQTYVLTARQGKNLASIKMVNHGAGGENAIAVLQYIDGKQVVNTNKDAKSNVTHPWANGDNLSVEGNATIGGTGFSQSLSMLLLQNETVTIVFPVSASSDGQPCPGSPTVTDIDNNTYNTVQLGNQCWMKENLRTTRYVDGTTISLGTGTSTTVPYRYAPDNDANNVATYGYLYNWAAVMHGANSSSNNPSGVQGICPNGWHVPSDAEWAQLITYVSGQSQYFCNNNSNRIAKALASTTGWNSDSSPCAVGNNQSTNNATGFSALPAGYCHGEYGENNYFGFGSSTSFWCATSSPVHNDLANYYGLNYFENYVIGNYSEKIDGFSVRCVRDFSDSGNDQSCPGTPTVTDIDNNTYNTLQLGNQCWMKENLRTTRYADGTAISMGTGTSTTVPYRYAPDNEPNNVAFYGYLYNWAAVMHGANSSSNNPSGVQGICPNGWHVPSDAEWTQLITYVSSQSQYFCNNNSNRIAKALASTTGWNSDSSPCAVGNNQSTNNATGFSALPAGYCHGEYGENNYFSFGSSTSFWCATSSPVHNDLANYYGLNYFENYVIGNYTEKIDGISVRCVRD